MYKQVTVDGKVLYEHRIIAGNERGKPLTSTEHVHHKDENKNNNDPRNLMVMRSGSDHAYLHRGVEPIYDPVAMHWYCEKQPPKCVDCGDVVSQKAKRCVNCYRKQNKNKYWQTENNTNALTGSPARDELIRTIAASTSFTQVGKKYGKSCNAVRKWLRKYDLPSSAIAWRKMTEAEIQSYLH